MENNFKKSSIVFLLLAFAGINLTALPTYAEEKAPVTTEQSEKPKEELSTDEEEEPGEKPGVAWDGIIKDPENTNIKEPAVPAETPAPAEAQPTPTPVVIRRVYVTTPTAPAETAAPAETKTPTEETPAETEAPAETTETTDIEEAEDYPPVEVPKTSHPATSKNTSRKIQLMAIISTGIVVFSFIGIMSGVQLFRIHRASKKLAKDTNPLLDPQAE